MPPTLPPGSGTSIYAHAEKAGISIRLLLQGCTNRPFYHIVVTERYKDEKLPVIEQLGSYDPIANDHNEKLAALNYERIRFWLGNGATLSRAAEQLLGLAGFFPIHPTSYMVAWRNRQAAAKKAEEEQKEVKQEEV